MYSPPFYATRILVHGAPTSLKASHQSNGNYSFDSMLPADFRDLVKPMFEAHDLPALYRGRQVTMAEALKMMALLDARTDTSALAAEGQAYAAFLQAQLDCFKSPVPPAEFVQARADFILRGTELLDFIQKTHLQKFALRELVYPVQSIAVSKQRTGVFLWPDWEDPRYANLVCNVEPAQNRQIRDTIHDWAEAHRLRLNIGTCF